MKFILFEKKKKHLVSIHQIVYNSQNSDEETVLVMDYCELNEVIFNTLTNL